jgi:hypothetical protein
MEYRVTHPTIKEQDEMHTGESVKLMGTRPFLGLVDQLSPQDLDNLISFLRGYSPAALAAALNYMDEMRGEPAPLPDVTAPEPPAAVARGSGRDAGEGNRALGEPGRALLREAIAEEDAKVADYEYTTMDGES